MVITKGDITHGKGDTTHGKGDSTHGKGDTTHGKCDTTHGKGDTTHGKGDNRQGKRANPQGKDDTTDNETLLIHTQSDCDVEYERCITLLNNGSIKIFTIHALESAISKAVNMVLKLQREYPEHYQVDIISSSVDLVDGLQIIAEEIEPEGLKHSCAGLHMVVTKIKTDHVVTKES